MTLTQIEKRLARLEKEFQLLREEREYQETLRGIREGVRQMEMGLGLPVDEAFKRIRNSVKAGKKGRK